MAYRKKLSKSASRKMFKRSSNRVHKKNLKKPIMRGGIRL